MMLFPQSPRPVLARRRRTPLVEQLEDRTVPAIVNLQQSFDMTEGVSSSPTVGLFSDTNIVPTSNFTNVMIDWGDGTPLSAGSISQPDGAGTPFVVTGTHTYAMEGARGHGDVSRHGRRHECDPEQQRRPDH